MISISELARLPILLYVAAVFAVESAWCLRGLRRLRAGSVARPISRALSYGLVRLLIGRAFAFLIVAHLSDLPTLAVYTLVVLPLRWLSWSLLAELVATDRVRLRAGALTDSRSARWSLAGTLLCCATDVLAFLGGLWVGEILP